MTATARPAENGASEHRATLVDRFREQQGALQRMHVDGEVPVVVDLDLTMQQLRALAVVGSRQGLTGADLAAALHVSPATVSGLVRRLERRDLVHREPLPADRRAKVVRLTDAGAALLHRLDALGTDLWAGIVGELTVEELADLVRLTDRILTILRSRAGAAPGPPDAPGRRPTGG
ncbi:MAG TPA: MarR family transcriptional regulator [Dermatophilaceae bacterium]|nr:MarR family transcriptional regulator [Dermatophilaceae bacterium]